jgi:hypothetical protein
VIETKAERAERLKRELNPWQAAEAIARFAREGRAVVPAGWLGTYLRWWGVYMQGDGLGAVGGTKGEGRVAASEVPAAIERLLTHFLAARRPGEKFRQFSARHTDDELRRLLAGSELAAVAREAPAGRVPHGLED